MSTETNTISNPAPAATDDMLLRGHVSGEDPQALSELIRRYAPMVYAAARRQTRNSDLAQDVMQNVFVTFARRAGELRHGAAVGTWLLRTTHYTSANAMRSQSRRQRIEKAAALQRPELVANADPAMKAEGEWQEIEPLLDQALARLGWADQTAVVLRFFRGLSLREVAAATGTSEEAARKRVSRALGRLRGYLTAAGAAPAACADMPLALMLSSRAIETVPAHLLAHATAAAGSAGKLVGGSFLQGVMAMTAGTKIVIGAAAAAIIVLSGAGVLYVSGVGFSGSRANPDNGTIVVDSSPALPAAPSLKQQFDQTYALAPGQSVKLVPTPFVDERWKYLQASEQVARDNSQPDTVDLEQQRDGSYKMLNYLILGGNVRGEPGRALKDIAKDITGLRPWQIQGDSALTGVTIAGDLVVRQRAGPAEILKGLEVIASERLGQKVAFTHDQVEHEMMVAAAPVPANFPSNRVFPRTIQLDLPNWHPIGNEKGAMLSLQTLVSKIAPQLAGNASGSGILNNVLDQLSVRTNNWFMDDTQSDKVHSVEFNYAISAVANDGKTANEQTDDLLASLSKQTGLTFKREKRTVDVWTLRPTGQ